MGHDDGFDDGADDDLVGAPPPMAERTWRHPTEVAWLAGRRRTRRHRRLAGLALGSAIGGGLILVSPWNAPGPAERAPVAQLSVLGATDDGSKSATSWANDVSASARTSTVLIRSETDASAIAAGVAVSGHGYIVTSSGALGDATSFVVRTDSGDLHQASLVGHDTSTDIAVIESDAVLPMAAIASDPIGQGDAVAVVDASGLAHADTVAYDAVVATSKGGKPLVGLLCLTASRDEIVAGGPVVDTAGTVVAITADTHDGDPTAAVPIDVATRVAAQLIVDGEATHGWLGVKVLDVDGRVEIDAVDEHGPAAAVGVEVGDHIVAVDGEWVDDTTELIARLRAHEPTETITVDTVRNGERIEFEIELGVAPAS